MNEQQRSEESDGLAIRHTAFTSMEELLNAPGGYRPSLNVATAEVRELADRYDALQESRHDPRRAARYSIRPRRSA